MHASGHLVHCVIIERLCWHQCGASQRSLLIYWRAARRVSS